MRFDRLTTRSIAPVNAWAIREVFEDGSELVRARYVEWVPDPTDCRARLVRLAARGEEARTIARALEKQIQQEWTRHLGVSGCGNWLHCWRTCAR